MSFSLFLSPEAINDIDKAVEYYNKVSYGLGFDFVDIIDLYFTSIKQLPHSSSIHYDKVRVKPVDKFPFNIHYLIEDDSVIILRVFNTNLNPYWE